MKYIALLIAAPVFAQSIDGVWRTQGYGYVLDIHGDTMKVFEVTATTCVPGFIAQRLKTATAGVEATFKRKNEDPLLIDSGGDDSHKMLRSEGSLSKMRIDRLPALPQVCDPLTANTPLNNFEVFTRTWSEHYISFDLRKIDFDKVIAENRAKVTPRTTPMQLFEVLNSMIKPFGDLHAGIAAPKLKRESADFFRPGTDRVIKGGVDRFAKNGRRELFAVSDRAYLHGSVRKLCNGQLEYGHIDDSTGYLRILAFGGYSKRGGFTKGLAALEAALDEIFSDASLTGFIVDVRLSFGGDDRYGLAMASRLTAAEYVAYAIQARAHPMDREQWTPADTVVVRPSTRPGFRGPVVQLIGPITMSGAETFTQALMGRNPHVTRIGENTQGVFCDVLDRHLPNGWTFGLPNAVYRTTEGTAFDVAGIAPDILVPVFADEDVKAGKDPAIAKALEILKK